MGKGGSGCAAVVVIVFVIAVVVWAAAIAFWLFGGLNCLVVNAERTSHANSWQVTCVNQSIHSHLRDTHDICDLCDSEKGSFIFISHNSIPFSPKRAVGFPSHRMITLVLEPA